MIKKKTGNILSSTEWGWKISSLILFFLFFVDTGFHCSSLTQSLFSCLSMLDIFFNYIFMCMGPMWRSEVHSPILCLGIKLDQAWQQAPLPFEPSHQLFPNAFPFDLFETVASAGLEFLITLPTPLKCWSISAICNPNVSLIQLWNISLNLRKHSGSPMV